MQTNDNQDNFEKPQNPNENKCPECGSTMLHYNHGMTLKCPQCGFTTGVPDSKELKAKELKPHSPNEDMTTT